MRHIHLAEGMRLRFPNRSEDFDQGVEIGMIAVLMELGTREFVRSISSGSLEQARSLAQRMGYRLIEGEPEEGGAVTVILRTGSARPTLRLVHSQAS
jgi:hypothetical protein